jgi:16S rRNA (cytosine1402-N4)-methyltransferase
MSSHLPVMLAEVLDILAPRAGGIYLDGTFGGGGYAEAVLDSAENCVVWAIDRDPEAIARGAGLAARFPGRLHLIEGNFGNMLALLDEHGVRALDGIMLDIGVSSFQLDDAHRGFSFRADGPLDMRMGGDGPTAADLVNTLSGEEIADILYQFGEERASRRIAKAILAARAEAPITTTTRLAEIIRVNDELGEIERGLAQAGSLLAPAGRLVVVSFHSLEDRIVKRFMTDAAGRNPGPSRHDPRGLTARPAPLFRLITPKALRPGDAETEKNPRSRSARLRGLERLGNMAESFAI